MRLAVSKPEFYSSRKVMRKPECAHFSILRSREPGFSRNSFGFFVGAAGDLVPMTISFGPDRSATLREDRRRFAHIEDAKASINFLLSHN